LSYVVQGQTIISLWFQKKLGSPSYTVLDLNAKPYTAINIGGGDIIPLHNRCQYSHNIADLFLTSQKESAHNIFDLFLLSQKELFKFEGLAKVEDTLFWDL
jgi:hypothetical protein